MDVKCVGVTFANVYYNRLCEAGDVTSFYFQNATSSITFPNKQQTAGSREEIANELSKLGVNNVVVNTVTCQPTSKESILIVVSGKMTRKTAGTCLFNQVFVLRARRTSVRAYAVVNDVLVLANVDGDNVEEQPAIAADFTTTTDNHAEDEEWGESATGGTGWAAPADPAPTTTETEDTTPEDNAESGAWGDSKDEWNAEDDDKTDGLPNGSSKPSGQVPSRIEKVNIKPVKGTCNAALSWTKPDSPTPLIGYRLTAHPSNVTRDIGLGKVVGAWGGMHSYTVTGLLSGRSYSFTVAAVNEFGSAPASPVTDTVCPVGPPLPPVNITAVAGNGEAQLTWQINPETPLTSKPVTSWIVNVCRKRSSKGATADTQKKYFRMDAVEKCGEGVYRCVVPGLTNATPYAFKVEGENEHGVSSVSAETETIIPAGPPPPPKTVRCRPKDHETIVVIWEVPAADLKMVDSFKISVQTQDGGQARKPLTCGASSKSISVRKLKPNTTYTFTVASVGPSGLQSDETGAAGKTPEEGAPMKGGEGDRVKN